MIKYVNMQYEAKYKDSFEAVLFSFICSRNKISCISRDT